MSRAWLLLVGAIALGGVTGMLMATDPGYVLVSWGDQAWETSLWFALILMVVGYVLIRLVAWLWWRSRSGLSAFFGWNDQRRRGRARELTSRGLMLWAEGDWKKSQQLLSNGARHADYPFVNHLFAARNAHAMGDLKSRDAELDKARKVLPEAGFALSLIAAEFMVEEGAFETAVSMLKDLRERAPKHPRVLHLLAECLEQLGDDKALIAVLDQAPDDALPPEVRARKARAAWLRRLATDTPGDVWRELPRALQRDEALVGMYVDRLVAIGQPDTAEAVIRDALKAEWRGEFVRLYGRVAASQADVQVRHAEGWLKTHEDDVDLLLTLGRLHLRNGNWDKAESYLKARLRLQADADVYAELGRVFISRGDLSRGADYLLQALQPVR
ncbi:MAG: heme biosynthesis HemY N-terminal domain-containing protein [Pseudomonadales bacterium]